MEPRGLEPLTFRFRGCMDAQQPARHLRTRRRDLRFRANHMSTQPTHDICRICGEYRPMTFEHVPARSSGNADARFTYTLAESWAKNAGRPARYRQEQRGAGEYALCEECQRLCNHRGYVREYGIWTRVGLTLLRTLGESDEHDAVGVSAAMRNVRPSQLAR
jgi:hypothetical protein